MTDVSDSGRRKATDRRQASRRTSADAPPPDRRNALVVAGPAARPERIASAHTEAETASAVFAAQLLGQPGVKRGLKGGPEVLEGARSAYLETEYLGKAERRAPIGVIAKREV